MQVEGGAPRNKALDPLGGIGERFGKLVGAMDRMMRLDDRNSRGERHACRHEAVSFPGGKNARHDFVGTRGALECLHERQSEGDRPRPVALHRQIVSRQHDRP